MTRRVRIGDREYAVEVTDGRIALDGGPLAADVRCVGPDRVSLLVGGASYTFHLDREPGSEEIRLGHRGVAVLARLVDPRRRPRPAAAAATEGRLRLLAPMAGRVVRCLAAAGDAVERGQGLLVLEAMKMQNEVRAPKAGRLLRLAATPGTAIAPGDLLAEIE